MINRRFLMAGLGSASLAASLATTSSSAATTPSQYAGMGTKNEYCY